jgi:hypothetical protein
LGFGNNSTAGDRIAALATDASNITYVLGEFSNTMDVDPSAATFTLTSHGGRDLFLAAFQQNQLLWAFSLGGAGNEDAGDLVLADNATLLVSGTFSNTLDADPAAGATLLSSNGGTDAFVATYTTAGNLLHAWSFGGAGNDTAGRLALDHAFRPAFVPPSFYLAGTFTGTADLDPGPATTTRTAADPYLPDTYLSRISLDGNLEWTNTYTTDDNFSIANLDVHASSNRLYFAGDFRGTVDLHGVSTPAVLTGATYMGYVAELNPTTGALVTASTFGDPTGPYALVLVRDFAVDAAGNLVIGGDFGGTIDVDPSAASHTISETQSPDGFTGFVLKLDASAHYLWAGALTGDSWSTVYALATDSANNIYLTGLFNHVADFDFAAGTHEITAPNTLNTVYVAKYDPAGRFLWEQHATAAAGSSRGFALAVGPQRWLAAAGDFANSVTFSTTMQGNLPVLGDTVLTGDYPGDNFLLFISQAQDRPTVTLTDTTPGAILGQPLTLSAKVSHALATPTGSVSFYDRGTLLGTATLDDNGVATITFTATAGAHAFLAAYNGSFNFAAVNSATVARNVAAANRLPTGALLQQGRDAIDGWVYDLDLPGASLVVQLLVDGVYVGSTLAGGDYSGLIADPATSHHGFRFQLPPMHAGTRTLTFIAYDPVTHESAAFATTTTVSSSLYFDESWYLATYADVNAAVGSGALASAWQHFQLAGAHEGRSPSRFFDEGWYRAHNPDVVAAITAGTLDSGFVHFVASGAHEGRDPSPLFNELYYRRANPDVAAAIAAGTISSGFEQFLASGLTQGRDPTPWFSSADYLAANPDVVKIGLNIGMVRSAFDHFLDVGLGEDRVPSTLFNETYYLAQNPDVAAAVASHDLPSGLYHFVTTGMAEGRRASPAFDRTWYLAQYPAAATAISQGLAKSAFQHYLLYGRLLGYLPHA